MHSLRGVHGGRKADATDTLQAYGEDESSAGESDSRSGSRAKARKGKGRASACPSSRICLRVALRTDCSRFRTGNASNTFQRRASVSESSEEDYGGPSQKKRKRKLQKRSVREFEMPRISSRNGKQLPNYNEAEMDFDLSGTDDGAPYAAEEEKGESPLTSIVDSL